MRQSKRGKETLRRESSMGEGLAVPNIIHTQFNLLTLDGSSCNGVTINRWIEFLPVLFDFLSFIKKLPDVSTRRKSLIVLHLNVAFGFWWCRQKKFEGLWKRMNISSINLYLHDFGSIEGFLGLSRAFVQSCFKSF